MQTTFFPIDEPAGLFQRFSTLSSQMLPAGITPENIENKGRTNLEFGTPGGMHDNKPVPLCSGNSGLPPDTLFSLGSIDGVVPCRGVIAASTSIAGISPEVIENNGLLELIPWRFRTIRTYP